MDTVHLVAIDAQGRPVEQAWETGEAAQDACRACALLYELYGFQSPWIGYLARVGDTYVGTCAFKSPPRDGAVEIAYMTFGGSEGRGYASAMAAALVEIASRTQPGIRLLASTPPTVAGATGILKRLGFETDGIVQHPEDGPVRRWRLTAT